MERKYAKTLKILMSFILAVLVIVTGFSTFSCNNSDDNNNDGNNQNPNNQNETPGGGEENTDSGGSETDTADETPKYADDDLGEYDFEGYVFRNIAREGNNMDVEEEIGEVLNDAIYYRNRNVEERFNFEFKENIVPSSDYAATQRKSLLAGDKAYDIMVIRAPDAYTFAQEGLLHPMTSLPHINLEKPYWDKWVTGQWSIANKIYFAAGAYAVNTYSKTGALLFNKKLAQDLGIENLYTVVNEGKWTFDKFAEVGLTAKRDLNGDGVITMEDQHAYLGTRRFILPAFWTAGGVKTIEKDNDDIPYLSALDEKFINVWNKLTNVLATQGVWFDGLPDNNLLGDPLLPEIFKDGRALFYDVEFSNIPDLRDMEIDFGILPYPKYNEQQEKYITRMSWAEMVSIPLYCDDEDLARTSVILEALACESAKSVIPVYYELALKTKGARDAESEAMIDLLFASRVFDWGDTIWNNLLRDGIFPNIFPEKADTVVSALEKAQGNIQKTINSMVEAFLALD